MQPEAKKFLYDIIQAADLLDEFSHGKMLADYGNSALLRSAVERQFEIIGECLSQLAKIDADCVARISEYKRIIAFRNILIHGYAQVDDLVVWDVLETKLPVLRREVAAMLDEIR